MMKKLIYILLALTTMLYTVSCDDDAWTTDPDKEHIYYVGFHKSYSNSENLQYQIATDGTAQWRWYVSASVNKAWEITSTDGISSNIPIDFHSERVRSYNVVTYFWVSNSGTSDLILGTDYIVVDESGTALNLTDGKYSLTWPQAIKGTQNIRIKRLSSKKGVLKVNTLDPAKGTPSITTDTYIEATRNNLTNEYEVRGLSHDYDRTTVTFN